MGMIKFAIGLGAVALALVLIFFSLRRFGIPVISELGDTIGSGFESASSGIADFFNSFDNNDGRIDGKEGGIRVDGADAKTKEITINPTSPGALTPEEVEGAKYIKQTEDGIFVDGVQVRDFRDDKIKVIGEYDNEWNLPNWLIPKVPSAFADDSKTIAPTLDPKRPLSLTQFAKNSNQSKRGTTSISGDVRSELDTDQKFTVTSADSSRPVRGVIRKRKQKPQELRVDSVKKPLESASARANRVFVETGKFADESRGAASAKPFDFGTNTGKASRIQTRGNTASRRLAERLQEAEEKAKTIFDSRSISNF